MRVICWCWPRRLCGLNWNTTTQVTVPSRGRRDFTGQLVERGFVGILLDFGRAGFSRLADWSAQGCRGNSPSIFTLSVDVAQPLYRIHLGVLDILGVHQPKHLRWPRRSALHAHIASVAVDGCRSCFTVGRSSMHRLFM